MVAEKMKLKILAAIASDLAMHVDAIFDQLTDQSKKDFSAIQVIEVYTQLTGKHVPTEKVTESVRKSRNVVDIHRQVIYIFYVLNCPFYEIYGIHEQLRKDKLDEISEALSINRRYIAYYIISGRHNFKFYKDFRGIVSENLEYNRKL